MDLVREIPATEMAPSTAREALSVLSGAFPGERYDLLQLIVSELVTNCVRHGNLSASEGVVLTVRLLRDHVRVEVEDCGSGFTAGPRPVPQPDAEGGRGLFIVQELADRWGVDVDGQTVVWAE